MTDPVPSPAAGQPPVPHRPMPRLGRGACWSAHPDLDGIVPPAEPYQPPPRTRPAGGWPKTGNLGATARLADDEHPFTVPARPYADARANRGQHPDRVAQLLRDGAWTAPARRRWFARAIGWFRR